ncbi:MAG TPA: helix-turn-helix domain-containing protein, partial [Acidimicrobiales bacterium]
RTRLQGMVGDDAPVLAATGSAVADVHDTPRSFFEAEVALGLLRRRPGERELRFATLGVTGLMLSVPRDRLRDFVNRHLGPIADREDLLDTLAAWLDTNGSRVAVARQLGLHRNSVGYRMGRIRVALKHNPFDASDALQLRVALAAREVLAVLDELAASERGEPVNPRPPRGERWPIA